MTDGTADTPKSEREARLRAFAADMQHRASMLERDIKAEEDRSGKHDPSDIAYPMLARAMRDRRRNIGLTLVTLESVLQAGEPQAEAQAA